MKFKDRVDAGKQLAKQLRTSLTDTSNVMLFALPRGGAVLGAEVAKELKLPFDLIVTRKIGHPANEEFAIGALAETGEAVWDEEEKASLNQKVLDGLVKKELKEAKRRIDTYREGRRLPDLHGKTAVIIDDGVATGATMRAAMLAAKHQGAERVIVAVPHGAKDSFDLLRSEGATVIALEEPVMYGAVGAFYDVFGQTTDEEVISLMKQYGANK